MLFSTSNYYGNYLHNCTSKLLNNYVEFLLQYKAIIKMYYLRKEP